MVKFILNTEFQPSMVTLEYIRSHGKEKKKPANSQNWLEKGPLFVITHLKKKAHVLIFTDSNGCECTKKKKPLDHNKMPPRSQEAVRGNNSSSVKHRFTEECAPLP